MHPRITDVRSSAGGWLPLAALTLLLVGPARAAVYYTALDGSDANPGSSNLPWRTIQKAANTLQPGDAVVVRPGAYGERVTTARGGTGEAARVTFRAEGSVSMLGWAVDHPYVTVGGFDVTGWSSATRNDGHVDVRSGGDFFVLEGCRVRDGIQIARPDMMFHAGSNIIASAAGGFLGAGFATGQSLVVEAATNGLSIANGSLYTVLSATDTELAVTPPLASQGPVFAYLSASYVWGLHLRSGSSNVVIRGNLFRNLAYDTWFVFGGGHLFESNVVERVNGWDAMHFGGSGHLFRRNVWRDSPLVVYQTSPDAWENYSPAPYSDVVFFQNYLEGFAGVLASQKGQNTSYGLLLSHNVLVDIGRFVQTHPGTVFENNTLLRVARTSNPVTSRASHPLYIASSLGATNAAVLNNVFVDCGEPSGVQATADVGWYEIAGSAATVTTCCNFAAGPAPAYAAKPGFDEGRPDLNGGDPGFVDIADPLGPDGLPFTEDDGLRLRADSKLRRAGYGGVDLGAYNEEAPRPALGMEWQTGGIVRIVWPASFAGYALRSAPAVTGVWSNVPSFPIASGGTNAVEVPAAWEAEFFQLSK
jgi:hypothetical protein